MMYRSRFFAVLVSFLSVGVLSFGVADAGSAEQKIKGGHYQSAPGKIYGKVTQTMDAAGYTYAEVDTGKEKVWAAARKTVLKKGDMIAFSAVMPMKKHYSKSLKREFAVVYFVNRFITDNKPGKNNHPVLNMPHAHIKNQKALEPVEGIKKIEGGHTISDIYKNKTNFKGKSILVRGKVTKFTAKVMNKNWLHIMDGSTHNDLTITTDGSAAVGDVVVIEGKLELDKDYKYGYVYPLIVENAKILK